METQEVCPGGSCHLIYLGILAYTILKIVFSAFLSFLLITGWFKLVPTEGEMHTHTTTSNLNTSDLSCAVKTKTHLFSIFIIVPFGQLLVLRSVTSSFIHEKII